ncbi:transposase [Bradyrhizobium sp. 159]|nr:transposase [Bradyrhizobium sp. 159]MCK1619719.1 transposase [Bradyrhizobium sp. 159]
MHCSIWSAASAAKAPNSVYGCAKSKAHPLEACLREQRAPLSNSSSVTKPIEYMLHRWDRFTRFINQGRIFLTTQCSGARVARFSLGRKSWPFAGSERGADRAAIMAPLIS